MMHDPGICSDATFPAQLLGAKEWFLPCPHHAHPRKESGKAEARCWFSEDYTFQTLTSPKNTYALQESSSPGSKRLSNSPNSATLRDCPFQAAQGPWTLSKRTRDAKKGPGDSQWADPCTRRGLSSAEAALGVQSSSWAGLMGLK